LRIYGNFSFPDGSYDSSNPDCFIDGGGQCGDGFRGSADSGLFLGIGGYISTNTPPASIGLFLGNFPSNLVDFGETCDSNGENCISNAAIGTSPKFFGVIDALGFNKFEFRELEGKLEIGGGDIKFISADDFSFAQSSIPSVPLPAALPLFGTGLALMGFIGWRRKRKLAATAYLHWQHLPQQSHKRAGVFNFLLFKIGN